MVLNSTFLWCSLLLYKEVQTFEFLFEILKCAYFKWKLLNPTFFGYNLLHELELRKYFLDQMKATNA